MNRRNRLATGLAVTLPMALAIALAWGVPATAQPASTAPDARTTSAPAPVPAGAAEAPLLEPYRFNARERTARALAAWGKGKPEDAVAPLDSALRLQPGDPLVEFNAGTAHFGANQPDAAALLEQAAKHAPPTLAADAYYNLGNARLDAKDARGAIDAYKGALRAQPDLANAKRNLELAVRLLEEQKQQQEQQQKDQQNDQKKDDKDQQQQNQQGGQGEGKDPQQKPQQNPDGQQKPQPDAQQNPSQQDQPQQGQPQPQERPLPQFQDQKDMTAEQAAAILQAVENLERQQRREQARALARAKTSVEKDW
ncbi:MAG: tetratricopeptide repeat protein [Thermoanaerobaculia bacterium]